jgi:hypothetical protein
VIFEAGSALRAIHDRQFEGCSCFGRLTLPALFVTTIKKSKKGMDQRFEDNLMIAVKDVFFEGFDSRRIDGHGNSKTEQFRPSLYRCSDWVCFYGRVVGI